ncbi:MAG TPA: SufE family protein [Bacteroidales bacterium]|nr:SufE family protein [Bacteroidales bacterium]
MSAQLAQQQIIEEFSAYDDWLDKYNLLIEMGKDTPAIDPRYKTNNHLINGCQSRVWLHAELRDDGKVYFSADSDAVITKGMIGLLIRVLSGRTPEEILNTDLYFVDAIGLTEHLSPTRSNGLVSMIKQMKLYAQVFQLKAKN